MNWQTGVCSVYTGFSMKLFEIVEQEFLFQTIKSLTRFREGENPSLLDLAFTKYPNDVTSPDSVTGGQTAAFIQLVSSKTKKIGTRCGYHDGQLAPNPVIGKLLPYVIYA